MNVCIRDHEYDPLPDPDRPTRAQLLEDDLEIRRFRKRWHERQQGTTFVDGYRMMPNGRAVEEEGL